MQPKHQGSNQCHAKALRQTPRCLTPNRRAKGGTNQPEKSGINQDISKLKWNHQVNMRWKSLTIQPTATTNFSDFDDWAPHGCEAQGTVLASEAHRAGLYTNRTVRLLQVFNTSLGTTGTSFCCYQLSNTGLAFTTTSTSTMARNACITKMKCHCSCHGLSCSTLWLGRLVGHLPTHVTRAAHAAIHPIHMTHATHATRATMHMSAWHVFRTFPRPVLRCRSSSGCTHCHGLLHTEAAVVLAFLWPHATSHVLWPVGVSIVFG